MYVAVLSTFTTFVFTYLDLDLAMPAFPTSQRVSGSFLDLG